MDDSKATRPRQISSPRRNQLGFGRQDLLLSISLIGGVFGFILILAAIPAVRVVARPYTSAFEMFETDEERGVGQTGMYDLGDIQLSLGEREQYVDSSIALEYDCGILRVSTKGKITHEGAASDFFKNKELKIKTAIVSVASSYSSKQISKYDGLENFRDDLMDAINKTFSKNKKKQPITNVYFQRFTFFSPDRET